MQRADAAASLVAGAKEKQGRCFVFGTGDGGQLGLGDDVIELLRPRLLDTVVPAGLPVLKVACGGMHTLAIVQGGLVYSWGVNDEGVLGRRANKEDPEAESKPAPVNLGSKAAVDLSTGDSHAAVVTADGAIMGWGTFRTSSGLYAFTPEGEQICRNPQTRYVPDSDAGRATAVASGTDHVLVLTKAGDVYSFGCGEKGRLGRLVEKDADNINKRDVEAKTKLLKPAKVPNLPSGVTSVVAGSYHCFAIAASMDGSRSEVFGWGLNSYGQLGIPYDFNMPASSQLVYFPKRVDELCGRKFIAGDGGENHTVMLSASGDVYSCGRSAYGRLGLPSIDPSSDEPHPALGHVTGVTDAVAVVAGGSTSGAVTGSGEAYVWGYGDLGQLGRGQDQSDAMTAVPLAKTKKMEGDKISALSFGGQHAALVCLPSATEARAAKRAR